jgi:Flp pilus assembly protein TadD
MTFERVVVSGAPKRGRRGTAVVVARERSGRETALLATLLLALLLLAAGCTKQVAFTRSPFIRPAPEGKRLPSASTVLPAAESATATVDGQPVAMDTSAARLLRELKAGQKARGGTARAAALESPAVTGELARVAANPRDPLARLALARAYHHERIYDLALQNYEAARTLAPDNPEVARGLGSMWVDLGAPQLGLPFLDEAIRLQPFDVDAWSYRGIALDLSSRYLEAEEAFRRALRIESRRWDLFNNLGYNLLLQERHAEAAEVFQSGLAVAPGHAVLLNNLGLALGFQGKMDEALAAFRKGGAEAEAWNNLGVAYRYRGETRLAVDAFQRAARLDPGSRAVARNLRESRFLLAAGEEQAAGPSGASP